jgi:hypothetical protein
MLARGTHVRVLEGQRAFLIKLIKLSKLLVQDTRHRPSAIGCRCVDVPSKVGLSVSELYPSLQLMTQK